MNNIQYKIIVRENPMMGNFDIFMYKNTPQGRYFVTQEKGTQTETKIEEGAYCRDLKPNLSLHRDMLQQLLQEITNLGVKLPDESKVRGQYEAQSEHLKDLRQLLKLK